MSGDHSVLIRCLSKVRLKHPAMTMCSDKDRTILSVRRSYALLHILSILAALEFGAFVGVFVGVWHWSNDRVEVSLGFILISVACTALVVLFFYNSLCRTVKAIEFNFISKTVSYLYLFSNSKIEYSYNDISVRDCTTGAYGPCMEILLNTPADSSMNDMYPVNCKWNQVDDTLKQIENFIARMNIDNPDK